MDSVIFRHGADSDQSDTMRYASSLRPDHDDEEVMTLRDLVALLTGERPDENGHAA